ncbi:hypothetical protein PCANC_25428 [Puccinia coronata f. sp. avenae]|uniref:RRM domain-containing protein n=1 Tax=Puccinia coronata f. sp. avenae TaxID=200324 RepID=A0A2N5S3R4_9BASI|nr:hypothetical protein PCANC_25428 [Puccinia coronata f. sp. avenae]
MISLNDGTDDIGTEPFNLLLLQGLGSDSSPEDIRRTLTNLPDASQTYDPQTIRRIILIRRSTTGASMGFAFVEFEDMEHTKILWLIMTNIHLFPRGFTIGGNQVLVTSANPQVFRLVPDGYPRSFEGNYSRVVYRDVLAICKISLPPWEINNYPNPIASHPYHPPGSVSHDNDSHETHSAAISNDLATRIASHPNHPSGSVSHDNDSHETHLATISNDLATRIASHPYHPSGSVSHDNDSHETHLAAISNNLDAMVKRIGEIPSDKDLSFNKYPSPKQYPPLNNSSSHKTSSSNKM